MLLVLIFFFCFFSTYYNIFAIPAEPFGNKYNITTRVVVTKICKIKNRVDSQPSVCTLGTLEL